MDGYGLQARQIISALSIHGESWSEVIMKGPGKLRKQESMQGMDTEQTIEKCRL